MKVNEEMLQEYIDDECLITVFDTEKEYLEYINQERKECYSDIFPNDFKTIAEAKRLAVEYQLEYKGKIYLLGNDDVVFDVLGIEVSESEQTNQSEDLIMLELKLGTVFEDSNENVLKVVEFNGKLALYDVEMEELLDIELYTFDSTEEIIEMFAANNNPIEKLL